MQITDQALNPVLNMPSVEVVDLVKQRSTSRTLRLKTLVFGNEIEDWLRPGPNVCQNRGAFVQREGLRHVARHEITTSNEFAGIRLESTSGDLQKSGLPGTVAPNESDPFSFVDGEGCLVKHRLDAVPDNEFPRTGNRVRRNIRHVDRISSKAGSAIREGGTILKMCSRARARCSPTMRAIRNSRARARPAL